MRDRGYFITGDLRDVMIEEAREDQKAEKWDAFYDGLKESDEGGLREMLAQFHEEEQSVNNQIRELEHQIRELKSERENVERKREAAERELYQRDPEVIVSLTPVKHRGQFGYARDFEKKPIAPEKFETNDLGTPMWAANKIKEITDSINIDPQEYIDKEIIYLRLCPSDGDVIVEGHVTINGKKEDIHEYI